MYSSTVLARTLAFVICSAPAFAQASDCVKSAIDPVYPPLARQARIQGSFDLHFQIDDSGKAVSIESADKGLLAGTMIHEIQEKRLARECAGDYALHVNFVLAGVEDNAPHTVVEFPAADQV